MGDMCAYHTDVWGYIEQSPQDWSQGVARIRSNSDAIGPDKHEEVVLGNGSPRKSPLQKLLPDAAVHHVRHDRWLGPALEYIFEQPRRPLKVQQAADSLHTWEVPGADKELKS
jgi:hypothetical protein